jgi:hypothetical protein
MTSTGQPDAPKRRLRSRSRSATSNANLNLAQVSLRVGRVSEAEDYIAQAVAIPGVNPTRSQEVFAAIVQADLLLQTGEVDTALQLLGAALNDPAVRESDRQEIERVVGRGQRSSRREWREAHTSA